jgi:Rps23 Pro-64 3,4-dihydroxylase Tpa1-like proline 4-hydroxylase
MENNQEIQSIDLLADIVTQAEQTLTMRERALLTGVLSSLRENHHGLSSELNGAITERISNAVRDALVQRLSTGTQGQALYKDTVPGRVENSSPLQDMDDNSSIEAARIEQGAQFVILEEFLVREELEALMEFVLQQQGIFQITKVMQHDKNEGTIDYAHRRSHVLFHLGKHKAVITERVRTFLPYVLSKLGHAPFPISHVEAQLTATNDGEYFRMHNDNTHEVLRKREITFVYYFYREPKAFTGGELRLYDSYIEHGRYRTAKTFQTIVPQQNQVVFFPSFLMHEVMPVSCHSRLFADSRFTINGWLHK